MGLSRALAWDESWMNALVESYAIKTNLLIYHDQPSQRFPSLFLYPIPSPHLAALRLKTFFSTSPIARLHVVPHQQQHTPPVTYIILAHEAGEYKAHDFVVDPLESSCYRPHGAKKFFLVFLLNSSRTVRGVFKKERRDSRQSGL